MESIYTNIVRKRVNIQTYNIFDPSAGPEHIRTVLPVGYDAWFEWSGYEYKLIKEIEDDLPVVYIETTEMALIHLAMDGYVL